MPDVRTPRPDTRLSRPDNFGPNAWLVDEMFEQFRRDPGSVSESWREFFEGYKPAGANLARPIAPTPGGGDGAGAIGGGAGNAGAGALAPA
ncbi:MAG: 2-oxoglutarate dehydrogenase E1 subunit family protein, partial [Acidimicrobiales bacterium]